MIQWIDTNGPPLCGIVETARHWAGTEGSSVGEARSDYTRACEVTDYVGKIACGPGEILLLGDEPLRSAFYYLADQALVIARWWSCESIDRAERALAELPSQLFVLEDYVSFVANTASLVMFDAAHRGTEPDDYRLATIAPGAYSVTSEKYELPGVFRFLIHRFLRQ